MRELIRHWTRPGTLIRALGLLTAAGIVIELKSLV